MIATARPARLRAALALVGVLVLVLLAGGARADVENPTRFPSASMGGEAPDRSRAFHITDEDFVNGSGQARASLFEIVPRTGGLSIPVSFGRALASYRGSAAEASSTVVKPPSGPSANCGGRGPSGNPTNSSGGGGGGGAGGAGSFPFSSTIEVGSGDKDSEAGRRASFASTPAGSPLQGSAQEQEVAATDDPFARAGTTAGRLALPAVAELAGGVTEARSGVVGGETRLAHAAVALDRLVLLDGLVTLEDLRWEATQRTGAGEGTDAHFTVGRVTAGGRPLPAPPSPGGAPDPLAAANTALAPTGLTLEAPRVEQGDGVARVTPLSLRVADSPLGRQVVGPVLGALQPVRDPVVKGLLAVSCEFATVVTVADVAAGILSGSGGVSFDVGGVSATTEGVRFDNPFAGPIDDGDLGVFEPEPSLPAAGEPLAPLEESPAVPVEDAFPAYSPPPPVPAPDLLPPAAEEMAAPAAARSPAASLGPSSRRLAGHRGGAALAVGVIGLAAVLALAAADALHLGRAARSPA